MSPPRVGRWTRAATHRPAHAGAARTAPGFRAGSLLPVVERIDPALVPEVFWRYVASRPPFGNPRTISTYSPSDLIQHLAWYDREVAAALFEPSRDRIEHTEDRELATWFSEFEAWSSFDPRAAVARLEKVPVGPDLSSDDARIRVARLARPLLRAAFANDLAGLGDPLGRTPAWFLIVPWRRNDDYLGSSARICIDQLDDPPPRLCFVTNIGPLLERRQGVGHRGGAPAEAEERVVVLGVADADDVVRGEVQLLERGGQAGRLVHARGQHHDRPFVEDDLPLQAQLVDGIEDGALVRLDRGDDRAPHG